MTVKGPSRRTQWEWDAFTWLLDHLEPGPEAIYISPEQWKLIRDREPVGGCSEVTEVVRPLIHRYNFNQLSGMILALRDRDCTCARAIIEGEERFRRMVEEAESRKRRPDDPLW